MIYFRCAADDYERFRAALDTHFGYPNPATLTMTAMPPANQLPRDDAGNLLCAIPDEFVVLAGPHLAAAHELTAEEFLTAVGADDPPA